MHVCRHCLVQPMPEYIQSESYHLVKQLNPLQDHLPYTDPKSVSLKLIPICPSFIIHGVRIRTWELQNSMFTHALRGSQCPTDAWLLRTTIRADLFTLLRKFQPSVVFPRCKNPFQEFQASWMLPRNTPILILTRFILRFVMVSSALGTKSNNCRYSYILLSFITTTQEGPSSISALEQWQLNM